MSSDAIRIARLFLLASLLAVGLVAAPTAVAGDPCYHGELPSSRTTGTDPQIKLAPCAFLPTVTYVATGATVTFFNGPTFTHLITGANQEWGSRDTELQPEQTVAYRFDEPGVYPYACALHRGMAGTIVVGDPIAALAAGSATDEPTTSTGAVTGSAADSASAAATPADTTEPTMAGLPLGVLAVASALAAGVGAVLGTALAWFAATRRRPSEKPISLPD